MSNFPNVICLNPGEELRQTEDKRQQLGQKAVTQDGREFVYAKAGEALDVGIPCQTAGAPGNYDCDTNAKLVTSITTYGTTSAFLRISTTWCAAGGAVTKNYFRDGYVWITSGTGAGQMMHIKENTTGCTGPAAQFTDLKFRDDECLHEAIDTQVLVAVNRNPYDSIIEYDGLATLTGRIVGVPPRDVTNAWYFWLQRKGPCPVLTDGTVVIGNKVYPTTSTGLQAAFAQPYKASTDTDAFQRASDNTSQLTLLAKGMVRPVIGEVLIVAADTEYSLVDLDI